MERINLNVPTAMRSRPREIARTLRRTESETARDLLAYALDRSAREEMHRRVAAAQTPVVRRRRLAILEAFERSDG